MKQIKIIGSIIVGAFSIITGSIALSQYFQKDIIKMEVKSIDKTQLTYLPDIEGLTVEYRYQDSIVENLWKMRYVISNVGSKTIIGKGDIKNILMENLCIGFSDSVRILSVIIDEKNFDISILNAIDNSLELDFKQWKQSEFIDITAIVENFGANSPFITIDEQDIIDSNVIISEYKPTENTNKKILDYLPPHFRVVMIIVYFCYVSWAIYYIARLNLMEAKKHNETIKKTFSKKDYILNIGLSSVYLCGFLIPLFWVF
jgi:hypothetical protein